MNRTFFSTLFAALLAALTANPAWGVDPPVAQTVPLDVTIVQNQPIELLFPNVFDLDHPKVLELHGVLSGPAPGFLAIFFDWFDTAGIKQTSPVQQFPFFPGAVNQVDMTFTIPFCPPQVSVDFRLANADVVRFVGEFTHTCIPEPSTYAMSGMALIGLGCVAWRKRKS